MDDSATDSADDINIDDIQQNLSAEDLEKFLYVNIEFLLNVSTLPKTSKHMYCPLNFLLHKYCKHKTKYIWFKDYTYRNEKKIAFIKNGREDFSQVLSHKRKRNSGVKRENTRNVNDRIKRSFEKSTVNTILFFMQKNRA